MILDDLKTLREHPPSVFGAEAHGFQMDPVLDEEDVVAFEEEYHVRLPEDFREFLTTIGNGGAGPFYEVFPLGMMDDNFGRREWKEEDGTVGVLREPFPFQEEWNDVSGMPDFDLCDDAEYWRLHEKFTEKYWSGTLVNGAIPICHKGCAIRIWLVISGVQAGFLWEDRRSEFAGLRPVTLSTGKPATFSEWYGEWLTDCLREAEP